MENIYTIMFRFIPGARESDKNLEKWNTTSMWKSNSTVSDSMSQHKKISTYTDGQEQLSMQNGKPVQGTQPSITVLSSALSAQRRFPPGCFITSISHSSSLNKSSTDIPFLTPPISTELI